MDTPVVTSDSVQTYIGQVKWFNNKSGYGFITVKSDGDKKDVDIFAHYSNIKINNSQYKYLVQGEYVEFSVVKSENETHEFQAVDITGMCGGPIMCEVRRTFKAEQDASGRRTVPSTRAPKKTTDVVVEDSA